MKQDRGSLSKRRELVLSSLFLRERIDFPLFHENVLCDLVSCRCLAGLCPMTFLHHQGQLESPKMFNVGQPELN